MTSLRVSFPLENNRDDDRKAMSSRKWGSKNGWGIKTLFCALLTIITVVSCERQKGMSNLPDPVSIHPCKLPGVLKKAVEKKLGKNCQTVESKDLATIKELKIQDIASVQYYPSGEQQGSDFTALEDLDLSNNPNMSEIPEFVYSIPNLKKLNISHTGVRNFSGKMCQLKKLTTLIASHNSYEGREIPIATFCLFNLQVLDMSSSQIRYIDEYIYYLKKLKKLYLKNNNLMILPFTIHVLPSLLVLDLRGNYFDYEPINSLTDCTSLAESSEERQECQRELLDLVECEYWYQMPFERGRSFNARFTEMTGDTYINSVSGIQEANCHNTWLNDYVSYYDPGKSYLLDLTANGKTIREWRLLYDTRLTEDSDGLGLGHVACQYHIKGISLRNGVKSSTYHFFMPKNTSWAPGNSISHPERYRQPEKGRPEYCSPIKYDTPQPKKPLGPWSGALPFVQEAIDKTYPHPESCEHWPTSRCPFQSEIPDAAYYLGKHSSQNKELFKDVYRKLHEDREEFKNLPSTRSSLVQRLQRDENERRYKETEEYFSKSVDEQETLAEEAWNKYQDILTRPLEE